MKRFILLLPGQKSGDDLTEAGLQNTNDAGDLIQTHTNADEKVLLAYERSYAKEHSSSSSATLDLHDPLGPLYRGLVNRQFVHAPVESTFTAPASTEKLLCERMDRNNAVVCVGVVPPNKMMHVLKRIAVLYNQTIGMQEALSKEAYAQLKPGGIIVVEEGETLFKVYNSSTVSA